MAQRLLQGSRAIVTGASSGIGRQVAWELSRHGVQLLITARRADRLNELAKQIQDSGGVCDYLAGDIVQDTVRRGLVDFAQCKWQGLDIVVNAAGVGAMGAFSDSAPGRLRAIFDVNFFAPAELIRMSIPLLKAGREAVIVNISSVLGHRAVPLKSEYCASKFALHGFSDAIRAELASHRIDVLLVSPSTTDSEFFNAAIEDQVKRNWKGRNPMSVEKVARATIRAIRSRKHEIILSLGGRALVWLDRLFPTLANKLLS